MDKVTSRDGTPIAFERLGDGPPAIVVCGATCDRALIRTTAEELAKHFTVFNYDRRGRGDSGDTTPYAVEREIEDLGALIAEAGGRASVYGHSSGAVLALRAAAAGLPIARLVVHEPPFTPEEEWRRRSREYGENLRTILAEDRTRRRGRAVYEEGRDAAGDGRADAERVVVGGDRSARTHARLRLRGDGRQQQGWHDTDRRGRRSDDSHPSPLRRD